MNALSADYQVIILLFVLFLIPKILQRFHIPAAITSFLLGLLCGLGFSLFINDPTIKILATLGIVSLFLFAGLEVDFEELKKSKNLLIQHLTLRIITIGILSSMAQRIFDLEFRPSLLVALALLTPSPGFIISSFDAFGLNPQERFWVKSKAIASELLALIILFFVLQSSSIQDFTISSAALAAMIVVLPYMFRFFALWIEPVAPKSEFTFLILMAVVCATITMKLGVYYLVGAFIVGMMTHRFKVLIPAVGSERVLGAIDLFASFFIPFYFFKAGVHILSDELSLQALMVGLGFVLLVVPTRIGSALLHRKLILRENQTQALRIGLSLTPTFIFTLVIAGILKERFQVPVSLFGGLIFYAVINTLLPGIALKKLFTPSPEVGKPPEQLQES